MSNVRRCRNGIKIINFSEKICSSVHMEPLSLVAKKWGGLRFREAVAGVTIAQLRKMTMMISLQHRCGCSTHKTMPRPGWSLPTNSWKGLIMASNPVEYSLRHLQFWVETKLFHVSASKRRRIRHHWTITQQGNMEQAGWGNYHHHYDYDDNSSGHDVKCNQWLRRASPSWDKKFGSQAPLIWPALSSTRVS